MQHTISNILRRIGISTISIYYLIGFDIITKIMAFNILPMNRYCFSIGEIFALEMKVNTTPLGTKRWASFSLLIAAFIFMLFKRTAIKVPWRVFICVISFFAVNFTINYVTKVLGIQRSYGSAAVLTSKLSMICALFIFWLATRSFYFKRIYGFALSAGLGNMLSHFYPPYGAVDFIVFKPISMIYGAKVIFNFADAYSYFAIVLFTISPIYFLFFYIQKRIKEWQPNQALKLTE